MLGFDALGRLALGELEETNRQLQIGTGVFTFTGKPTATSTRLAADTGSFSVSGQDVGLRATRKLSVGAASFALSGQAVGLHRELVLTADLGGFTFTGLSVEMSKNVPLVVGAGTFTLTGNAVGIRATRFVTAGAATFALSGQAVALHVTRPLSVGTGAFTLTGKTVRLLANRRLDASPFFTDSMAWLGFAPLGAVAIGQSATQARVTFRLSGSPVTLMQGKGLIAGTGAFTLSGQDTLGLRNRDIRPTIQVSAPGFRARSLNGRPIVVAGRPGASVKARSLNPAF